MLVTSRHQLTGLVATEGARPITLDLLPAADARELLARRLGAERLAAEPLAVEEILTRCARLPLALAIVAARAATEPGLPLATIAEQLRDARHGLDALNGGDLARWGGGRGQRRAVFSWSYRQLSPEAARTFRLLGLHPGSDATTPAISSVTALAAPPVRDLTRAHLLTEHAPGRYGFHDLLRAYASELNAQEDSPAVEQAGEAHSHRQLARAYTRLDRYDEADAHYTRAFELSGELGVAADQAQACLGRAGLFGRQGRAEDALRQAELAYELFCSGDDRIGQANALNTAGWHSAHLGDYEKALKRCGRALELLLELGDRHGQAQTWHSLGYGHHHLGDHERAVECYRHSLDLLRELGDRDSEASVLDHLGDAYAAVGDLTAAREAWSEALALLDELERTSDADDVRLKLA